MADSVTHPDQEDFGRHFKEYQICREEAARLESRIWQTASIFGVGAMAGISVVLTLIMRNQPFRRYLIPIMVMAIFTLNASVLWWRFVRRWQSIQQLKYDRMDVLERVLDFRQNRMVKQRDRQVIRQRRCRAWRRCRIWLRRCEIWRRRCGIWRQHSKHEYRGNLPVIKFFLLTTGLLWAFLLLVSILPEGHGVIQWLHMLCLDLLSGTPKIGGWLYLRWKAFGSPLLDILGLFVIVEIVLWVYFWRQR